MVTKAPPDSLDTVHTGYRKLPYDEPVPALLLRFERLLKQAALRRACVAIAALTVAPGVVVAQGNQPDASEIDYSKLSDDELIALAEKDAIYIWDTRPGKAFDRDTSLRLSGEQLAKRGATDLASALVLLPDVSVREGGRGGSNLDIRGGRRGSVRILIDGVAVSDPYYGTFDLSTIPITDIVQIRVSTTPQSPIDGPGGPAGVIEVHTRNGLGKQWISFRTQLESLPAATVAGTARVRLSQHWGLRISNTTTLGARDFTVPAQVSPQPIGDQRRSTTFGFRLEYRDIEQLENYDEKASERDRSSQRLVVDAFVDDRRYLSPPSETAGSLLLIDREQTQRLTVASEKRIGKTKLLARAWSQRLYRLSRNFRDGELTDQTSLEDLRAQRHGANFLGSRPFGDSVAAAAAVTIDHERAVVDDATIRRGSGSVTIIEPAANVQWQHKWLASDVGVGVAVPAGIAATPWLEAKATSKARRTGVGEIALTLARKGRLPSLRERFDSQIGNPALGPELATALELRAKLERWGVGLEVAPYWRKQTGSTRIGMTTGKLENIGELTLVGVDILARARVRQRIPAVVLGGAYTPVRATTADSGDALDRLPRHRGEGWLEVDPYQRVAIRVRARAWGRSVDQGQSVPRGGLLDATAAYSGRVWQVALRVDDILDARPPIRVGFFSPGRVAVLSVTRAW